MADLLNDERPIVSTQLPASAQKPRQVFVAYSYKLYPRDDYRRVFADLASAFDVEFVFADEKITTLHILQKIADYIRISRFGIYDISGWNANVTLELGLAYGMNERAFIAADPSKTVEDDVPADLRGLDRIQYHSYSELQDGVAKLLSQELPVRVTHQVEDQLKQLRTDATNIVCASEGLGISAIAKLLGISTDMAKLVIKPLIGESIQIKGSTRAAKYYPPEPST